MGSPRRVLVLDNAIYPEVYRPREHWRRLCPEDVQLVCVHWSEPLPTLEGFSHLIVSGSESSVMDEQSWTASQLELIRCAAQRGLAILGSCHGHQMLALALGGPRYVGHATEPEFGWFQLDTAEGDPMFAGATLPLWSFCSHFDEVTQLPPGFVATASSALCTVHAMRHRQKPIWGVQAHPEIDRAEGEVLLRDFAQLDPRVAAISVQRPARDSCWGTSLMKAFVQSAHPLSQEAQMTDISCATDASSD